MLRKDFIFKKISLIQEELGRLSDFKDYSLEEVKRDFYKYNTLERLLEKIIMRAADINQHIIGELATEKTKTPTTYKETFLILAEFGIYPADFAENIAKSVGTRNALVHDYDEEVTDYSKIYSSVNDCLRDYTKYCEYILKFVESH